jgi:hypothetical protein
MDKERPDGREAYEPLEIEAIAFEQEDVITLSPPEQGTGQPVGG